MAETELKPCPFCGSEARAENYVIEAAALCTGCPAKIICSHGPRDDNGLPEAIAAWNKRARGEAAPEGQAVACHLCDGRGFKYSHTGSVGCEACKRTGVRPQPAAPAPVAGDAVAVDTAVLRDIRWMLCKFNPDYRETNMPIPGVNPPQVSIRVAEMVEAIDAALAQSSGGGA